MEYSVACGKLTDSWKKPGQNSRVIVPLTKIPRNLRPIVETHTKYQSSFVSKKDNTFGDESSKGEWSSGPTVQATGYYRNDTRDKPFTWPSLWWPFILNDVLRDNSLSIHKSYHLHESLFRWQCLVLQLLMLRPFFCLKDCLSTDPTSPDKCARVS